MAGMSRARARRRRRRIRKREDRKRIEWLANDAALRLRSLDPPRPPPPFALLVQGAPASPALGAAILGAMKGAVYHPIVIDSVESMVRAFGTITSAVNEVDDTIAKLWALLQLTSRQGENLGGTPRGFSSGAGSMPTSSARSGARRGPLDQGVNANTGKRRRSKQEEWRTRLRSNV